MRKLTVTETFRYLTAERQAVYAPSLRLQGKWLAQMGFTAGCQVQIEGQHGEMTIRVIQGGEQA
ncbi:type I addiction module toxin, SymE family [Xylanibacillus composti]|uniref:Toxin SymE-like domain-containing protein n=1 Tax=Xylanibacillus composti TaxID=1572762 RepID=A0A8J4H7Z1_9BACL|nr:SymE family type I addiction module toxin [Xylanibacillus composti]MDT9727226.1 type I addiction module toxin, SymE family [Xylanibacillus composti]GIQ71476.1 hypothetical protein XYCOK13_43000 [Xylanibacillus composti]